MGKEPQNIDDWARYNGFLNQNLRRIADTLERINWNLGVIAYPELKKKYPKDAALEEARLEKDANTPETDDEPDPYA